MSAPVKKWLAIETKHLALGDSSSGPTEDPDVLSYLARTVECDGRKAEALMISRGLHPIQEVRTLLLRGHLDEANTLVESLENSLPFASPEDEIEFHLERARLHMSHGQWPEAIACCNRVEAGDPATVSRMTAIQIRAHAFFEIGDFRRCLREVESQEALGTLFPQAQTLFFARVVGARALARVAGTEKADSELAHLWSQSVASKTLNRDRMIVLLRAEIDLARMQGREIYPLAAFCFRLNDQLGDTLYRGLALVDLYSSGHADLRLRLEPEVQDLKRQFARIRETLEGSSTTARSVLEYRPNLAAPSPALAGSRPEFNQCESLYLQERGYVLGLEPLTCSVVDNERRFSVALDFLGEGKKTKADLFRRVYGRAYVSHLHDGVVRTLLSRMRKDLKISIKSTAGGIVVENMLISRKGSSS